MSVGTSTQKCVVPALKQVAIQASANELTEKESLGWVLEQERGEREARRREEEIRRLRQELHTLREHHQKKESIVLT